MTNSVSSVDVVERVNRSTIASNRYINVKGLCSERFGIVSYFYNS